MFTFDVTDAIHLPVERAVADMKATAQLEGYRQGLTAFAWWRDGVQYVGTTGTTLADAIALAKAGKLWNQKGRTDANDANVTPGRV